MGDHSDLDGDGIADHAREVDDIAEGPDPDTDAGPAETPEDIAEAERLMAEAETGVQGDWDLRGDDD